MKSKVYPTQAFAVVVGMVIFTDGYARVISIERVGGSDAMPILRFRCDVQGTKPFPSVLELTTHSSNYVSTIRGLASSKESVSTLHHTLMESIRRPTLPVLDLVSCSAQKLDRPAPARDLYCSTRFRMTRSIVEHGSWAILSARHGLVSPDRVLEPYDETLNGKSRVEQQRWAGEVLPHLPPAKLYRFWCGHVYTQFLAPQLPAELPLRGLGIGQQLRYLKEHQPGAVRC